MRFPSIIKVPRHRRFEIQPRYYDPIKEEIAERTQRIKEEMDGELVDSASTYRRISFDRKTSGVPNTSFLQLLIAAILGTGVIGWLYFGNEVFYVLWGTVPVYLFYRVRKNRRQH